MIVDMGKKMQAASEIDILVSGGMSRMMVSLKNKEEILKNILTLAAAIKKEIVTCNVIYKMNKRLTQKSSETKLALKKVIRSNEINFKCLNSSLSWVEAYIAAECDTFKHVPLSYSDIVKIAGSVHAEFCVSVEVLPIEERSNIIDLLVERFPIMFVSRGNNSLLIDLHELLLDKECFTQFLKSDEKEKEVQQNKAADDVFIGPGNRIGRKPLYVKFPSLIDCATNFIKEHSFAAHVRRRETTGTGTGVTLKEIQAHLLKNVPGLTKISLDTIHHLTTGAA